MSANHPAERTTRRRRKAERTPEIIAAGMQLFTEFGYANTRLDAVAERAGIAKSTIYLYFENKQKLFEATVEAHIISTFGEIGHLVDSFSGSSDTLLQLVLTNSYKTMMDKDAAAIIRIMIAEGQHFPELRKFYYDKALRTGQDLLARVIKRGIERGEFRDSALIDYPRMLIAPTFMATIWSMTFDEYDPVDLDSYMLTHVDLLLNGLKVNTGKA